MHDRRPLAYVSAQTHLFVALIPGCHHHCRRIWPLAWPFVKSPPQTPLPAHAPVGLPSCSRSNKRCPSTDNSAQELSRYLQLVLGYLIDSDSS